MDLPLAIRPCFIKGHAARFFWLTCTKGQVNLVGAAPRSVWSRGDYARCAQTVRSFD